MGTIKGINVDYPIVKGNTGFFKQTFDTLSAARSKIYILLKTDPRERVFNPTFGLGMRQYLFEPITQYTVDDITQKIQDSIAMYIPEVYISNLEVNADFNNNVDRNEIIIKLTVNLKKDPTQTTTVSTTIQ